MGRGDRSGIFALFLVAADAFGCCGCGCHGGGGGGLAVVVVVALLLLRLPLLAREGSFSSFLWVFEDSEEEEGVRGGLVDEFCDFGVIVQGISCVGLSNLLVETLERPHLFGTPLLVFRQTGQFLVQPEIEMSVGDARECTGGFEACPMTALC